MKKPQTFKLDESIMPSIKKLADADNRSVNNYVESILIHHIKKAKKA